MYKLRLVICMDEDFTLLNDHIMIHIFAMIFFLMDCYDVDNTVYSLFTY